MTPPWITAGLADLDGVTHGWWNESCVIHATLPSGGAWHPIDCSPHDLDGWEQAQRNAQHVERYGAETVRRLLTLLASSHALLEAIAASGSAWNVEASKLLLRIESCDRPNDENHPCDACSRDMVEEVVPSNSIPTPDTATLNLAQQMLRASEDPTMQKLAQSVIDLSLAREFDQKAIEQQAQEIVRLQVENDRLLRHPMGIQRAERAEAEVERLKVKMRQNSITDGLLEKALSQAEAALTLAKEALTNAVAVLERWVDWVNWDHFDIRKHTEEMDAMSAARDALAQINQLGGAE